MDMTSVPPRRKANLRFRVQTDDDLVVRIPHPGVARVESVNLAGEVAFRPLGQPHQFDRRMLRGVFLPDAVSPIEPSLTITHLSGRTVCAITDRIVNSMNWASLRAGVTRT